MSERELKNINYLFSSIGLYCEVEKTTEKYHVVIFCQGVPCCGFITNDLMKVRKYLINKINKLSKNS